MDLMKIGTFLQELRKEKGLTQEQLAEQLGVARRTVSRWETGANMPDLDILVAGHHGSGNATCEELLTATQPEIVVISVGENSYGHPDEDTLDRLEKYGCRVYRTDEHGTIVFRR